MSTPKFLQRLKMFFFESSPADSSTSFGPNWDEAIRLLANAKKVVVLTGAGMSAESGIATFRSKENGVWKNFDPNEVATPSAFKKYPLKVLEWHQSMRNICQNAEPNAGHYAIAQMQEMFPEVSLELHRLSSDDPVVLDSPFEAKFFEGEWVCFLPNGNVEVLEPAGLRAKVSERLKAAAALYG